MARPGSGAPRTGATTRELVPLVALGGGAGAGLRWLVGLALPVEPGRLPVATLVVDVVGALALGLLVGRWPDAVRLRALLGTGLLGGLTTTSSLALEADLLLADAALGSSAVALTHLAVTLVLGTCAAALGLRLGRGAARSG